jgi:hypothetical protein
MVVAEEASCVLLCLYLPAYLSVLLAPLFGDGRTKGRQEVAEPGRVRQETGVVEAFIAGTRGWLQWNASRLISRNIIYRLSCPYVARAERAA